MRDLTVVFPSRAGHRHARHARRGARGGAPGAGDVRAVRGLSYDLAKGEVLGVVGESGCGKSASALAIMGLLPSNAMVGGSVRLDGAELIGRDDKSMSRLRGKRVSMVFQDPMSALTPVYPVSHQLIEAITVHHPRMARGAAARRAADLLDLVGIPGPAQRARAFPHEFSGGMRQRVVIAMAIANNPDVIICDEPTTALDVTIQAQVLDVLKTARQETGAAILMITHDLGVIAGIADRVVVMYAGRAVETGGVSDIFYRPRMPYTMGLLGSVPRLGAAGSAQPAQPAPPPRDRRETVLAVTGLVKHYPVMKGAVFRRRVGTVRAVDGIDFDVKAAETVAIAGESGCGKTTTLLEVMNLARPQAGRIVVGGRDTALLTRPQRRMLRRDIQIVFQDPMASLDPRMPVGAILAEPLTAHGYSNGEVGARVRELLGLVGLGPEQAARYPRHFSGGQRQRIGIARALALEPRLLVLDEPVSALDYSIRAGVLNLLEDLQARLGLAYLFVAHDLSVVRQIADRVAIMYLGKIMEIGDVGPLFAEPRHPYTKALLSAVPVPDPVRERGRERILLPGDPPSPAAPPSGCRFRTRCPLAAALGPAERARCAKEAPALAPAGAGSRKLACHYAERKTTRDS